MMLDQIYAHSCFSYIAFYILFRALVKDIRDHKGLPNDEASLNEDAVISAK